MASTVRISDRTSEQLIWMVHRNATRALLPLLLAIGLTWLLLREHVDLAALNLWAGLTCAVVLARALLLRRLVRDDTLSQRRRRRASAVLSLCAGTAFGAVLTFFPSVAAFERAMLTAILLGVCSGAVSSNSGYRPLFLCYTLPMLGTLGLLWIVNPGAPVGGVLAACVGVSVLLVASTLAITAQDVFDAFALSVESSLELEVQAEELSEALATAERAQALAETTSASKTRFIAAASHDLRQPVHVLNLYSAALKSADMSSKVRAILDDMAIAVDSLSSQIGTLLDISELDSGAVEPAIGTVDLSRLVRELMHEFDKLAEDKGIRLVNELDAPLFVGTDPDMLCQILRNLCGNAIKFTRTGSVSFAAEVRGDTIALSIVDTGIGMRRGDSRKVFEEFYQVGNEGRDKSRGMGLGLSIVERLIGNLGHEIELDSTPGVGTRVTVVMARREGTPFASAATTPPDASDDPTLPAGFWVHLVDDDDTVRRGMETLLQSLGHQVTVSDSSASTVDFLAHRTPSAVLVDLHLGNDDSGLHIVDALSRTHPRVPVALITGESLTDPHLSERYPDLLVLQKPIPTRELLDLLAYMAELSPPALNRPAPADREGALESG